MFNLLPEQDKKQLRWEYRRRRLVVGLTMFLVVVITGLLLLIPLYILSYAKKTAAESEAHSVRETYGDTVTVPLAEINHTKALLKLIGSGQAATSSSFLISTVASLRGPGVRISSLSLQASVPIVIQVQGIAVTREALRTFANTLEATKMFDKVDVPVSSFARESDIPFTVGITLKKEKK